MTGDANPEVWTKSIPPARNRLQSRVLVWSMVPILCVLCISIIATALNVATQPGHRHFLIVELGISFTFAMLAWRLKAATPAAAACGGVICFILTSARWQPQPSLLGSGLPPLILLFVLTFAATRFGRTRKEARGLSEARTGRRASQVIANLGIAPICAYLHRNVLTEVVFAACIAALAEATADTVSSEIGQAIGGPAFLITSFRPVPSGTDGAVSFAGTMAGLLAAAAVIYAGLPHPLWSVTYLAFGAIFAASTLGMFFDSLLGATLERSGWIGNDLVNFTSTAFAAAMTFPLSALAMSFFHV